MWRITLKNMLSLVSTEILNIIQILWKVYMASIVPFKGVEWTYELKKLLGLKDYQ